MGRQGLRLVEAWALGLGSRSLFTSSTVSLVTFRCAHCLASRTEILFFCLTLSLSYSLSFSRTHIHLLRLDSCLLLTSPSNQSDTLHSIPTPRNPSLPSPLGYLRLPSCISTNPHSCYNIEPLPSKLSACSPAPLQPARQARDKPHRDIRA